jgi:hypothetical protein
LAQQAKAIDQHAAGFSDSHRSRAVLLAELAAGCVDQHWDMDIRRLAYSQEALQVDLPGRRGKQIGTAHNLGDFLVTIIHNNRELVGEQPIRATYDEVTDVYVESLPAQALYAIGEIDLVGADFQSDRVTSIG